MPPWKKDVAHHIKPRARKQAVKTAKDKNSALPEMQQQPYRTTVHES
jgi:hypothetical protein